MVSEEAIVGHLPSKKIGDDENGDVLVVSDDVGVILGEFAFFALGLAIPSEAGDAALSHTGFKDERKLCCDESQISYIILRDS